MCFYGDEDTLSRLSGAYRCDIPVDEEPAEPTADLPPAQAAAGEAVIQPVEIVITEKDLVELIPTTPQILTDRGPFGLKNAHTNFFVSDHRPQTISRIMFGQQVEIIATPVEYRWGYGDGATLITALPGYPTDVFNTQTDTGDYTVSLTTVFEGTYQVGNGPEQAVSSTVTQSAEPVDIQIWRAVTRNVDQTCLQNPDTWGY